MAYQSASKRASTNSDNINAQERRTGIVIPTVRNRSTMVFVSSTGKNVKKVKPIVRFK